MIDSSSGWPWEAANSRKDSAASVRASLMGNFSGWRGVSSSSIRDRVTRELTRSRSFSVWAWAFSIHFWRPVSISWTFRLVAMTVMGVFSSWLASVMNCRCRSTLRTTGSTALRENSTTMTYTSRIHTAMAERDRIPRVRHHRDSWWQSRNTAIHRPFPSLWT